MSKKFSSKTLPFAYDTSSLFLPWMMMLMVFLAALSLAGTLAAGNMTAKWNAAMEGELSVQILPPKEFAGVEMDRDMNLVINKEINKAADFLKDFPGVARVNILSFEKLSELLKPWLGDAVADESFPLPRLIDVELQKGAKVDLDLLKTGLANVAPNASLDVHKIWLAKLMKLTNTINMTAVLVLALVLMTTAFVVIYATVTSLDVHKPAIELLHLIGARDSYIAMLFSYRTMTFSFGGAVLGILFSLPIMLVTGKLAKAVEVGMIADAGLTSWNWFYIAIVPFVAAGVCGITAYITVAVKLRRVL